MDVRNSDRPIRNMNQGPLVYDFRHYDFVSQLYHLIQKLFT